MQINSVKTPNLHNKSQIREFAKEYRKSLDSNSKKDKDLKILNQLLNLDVYENADEIFLFSSLEDEIDTKEIFNNSIVLKKKVAFPKCTNKNGEMEFFYVSSLNELKRGCFNVFEPISCCIAKPNKNSLIIVPALACDKLGFRVGYGKGYYDNYLKNNVAETVCLCYNDLLVDRIDTYDTDVKVNFLITENEIIEF